MYLPLVIGPVDRRKGLSREIEQANTHNSIAGYPWPPWRVKTPPWDGGRHGAGAAGATRDRAGTLRAAGGGHGVRVIAPGPWSPHAPGGGTRIR
ncbi:hypothetical protein SAMN05216259_109241 [Actinacidiphila guanduensis]|uniref:Uncharacterized protein n=1 Tax=Actinacidiphila guanduensis TaxID=310781 RepID=A0A1H0J5W0_9ACTN|nr:hypothetical protein SAMN05216259_109241 [Actinacidiphila guanduensis]